MTSKESNSMPHSSCYFIVELCALVSRGRVEYRFFKLQSRFAVIPPAQLIFQLPLAAALKGTGRWRPSFLVESALDYDLSISLLFPVCTAIISVATLRSEMSFRVAPLAAGFAQVN